ncbi:uncharacterized protein [Melanerpes formicivorus]|uniref:uncharacterized protein n=1 Tax=Melanerpes formicivorus TaxID=211600 RepID=UPI00358FCE5C
MDTNKRVRQKIQRALSCPEEETVAAGSQQQQHERPQPPRAWRKCRKTTSERQERDQTSILQVYKFRTRAPSTSGEGSLGVSWIPAPTEDGNIVEELARSARYWAQQEPPQCWVRDCTGLCRSAAAQRSRMPRLRRLLRDEDSFTSQIREELLSMDEDQDSSSGDFGTASSRADVGSGDAPRSFAEEYSLAPLNTRKKYSAQGFDQLVENFMEQL